MCNLDRTWWGQAISSPCGFSWVAWLGLEDVVSRWFTHMVGKLVLAVSRELSWRYGPQNFVPFHISFSMNCLNFSTTHYLSSKSEHPTRTGVFQYTEFLGPVLGHHIPSLPPYSTADGTYKSCPDTRVHRLSLLTEVGMVLKMLLGWETLLVSSSENITYPWILSQHL